MWRRTFCDVPEAIRYFKLAIRFNPELSEARYHLGIIYLNQREFDLAEENFKKALELKPDYAEAHNSLAVAYFHSRQPALAIAHYRQALKLRADIDAEFSRAMEALISGRAGF